MADCALVPAQVAFLASLANVAVSVSSTVGNMNLI